MSKPSILAVFAHPDDESFGPGGTLAKYASLGHEINLLCATKGEAGKTGDPPLCTRENLGPYRTKELLCAAKVLGIKNVRFLGYIDKKLEEADFIEVLKKVTAAIRELKPAVVITFPPDGISGHPDHIAIHKITREAFKQAGNHDFWIDGLDPHQPQKLYYIMFNPRVYEALGRKFNGDPGLKITTAIDISQLLDYKIKAIHCHQTQIFSIRKFFSQGEDTFRKLFDKEYFHRAEPTFTGNELEEDFFQNF